MQIGTFQDSDFAGDLEDQNPLLEERCASLEVIHLFQ